MSESPIPRAVTPEMLAEIRASRTEAKYDTLGEAERAAQNITLDQADNQENQ